MEIKFHCLNCGVEFSEAEAKQAGCKCPECGADLTEIASADTIAEQKLRPGRIVFAVLVLLGIGALFFFSRPAAKMMDVDEILAKYQETDAKTPMMIDKSTRLDHVAVEGKTVTFKTTLVDLGSEDEADDVFMNKIGPFLTDKYCDNKNSRKAMGNGVTYNHEISTNDGKLLYSVTIGLNDC